MLIQLFIIIQYVEIKNTPCVHRSPATITIDSEILSANRIIIRRNEGFMNKKMPLKFYIFFESHFIYYAVNRINFLFLFQSSRARTLVLPGAGEHEEKEQKRKLDQT